MNMGEAFMQLAAYKFSEQQGIKVGQIKKMKDQIQINNGMFVTFNENIGNIAYTLNESQPEKKFKLDLD